MYCPSCNKIFRGWQVISNCDQHESSGGKDFPGIYILQNFITSSEADKLVKSVDEGHWDLSQSGRRKKNFGPKVNFKKKKLRIECFQGFSDNAAFVRKRLNDVELINNFHTIEECYLEYDSQRGSHIEPHLDDVWIWGERIVTVNCIGDSVLTFTKHIPTYPQQYNLDCIEEYKEFLIEPLSDSIQDNMLIRIPMAARSLIIIYGSPRYQFEHSVLREDISDRRVCIAYREFTPRYLNLCEHFR